MKKKLLIVEKVFDMAHVVVSGGVVYRSSRDSDYNYVSGDSSMVTPEEMKIIVAEDREALEMVGLEDQKEYFEEFFEVTLHGVTKKYAVNDYIALITMFTTENAHMFNTII